MSKVVEKQKLSIDLRLPEFSVMRITPPAKLEPFKISPIEFDDQNSYYEPFSQEILSKIGVKFEENNGIFSSLISELSCVNCTACKAISKDTLMELDSANFERTEKKPEITEETAPVEEAIIDEEKKHVFKKIWKEFKKKQIKPSKKTFETAFKECHNLSESEWEEKVKHYFS